MNNQQTIFSVRVSKVDFVLKALKAYTYYSKLSKESLEESNAYNRGEDLCGIYTEYYLNYKELSERVKNIISMVNISSDEFVDVTEDIYKLIYKYDS